MALSSPSVWPFSNTDLLKGLRRYLADTGLQLGNVTALARPAVLPGEDAESEGIHRLQPFLAEVQLQGGTHQLALLLKQSQDAAIAREKELLRFLAPYLPILTPGWIGAETGGSQTGEGWLITELPDPLRPIPLWDVDDYREAVDNLAMLHDAFWGLGGDLETFGGLVRPLDRDFPALKESVQGWVEQITAQPPLPGLQTLLAPLPDLLPTLAETLQEQPFTLLHGDYWPDNIARPVDGRQMVMHWHQAGVGPAILDVVMFHQRVSTHLTPVLPLALAIARYRSQLNERQHMILYDNEKWEKLWDYALLWTFASRELGHLCNPHPGVIPHLDSLDKIWLQPVRRALERQFGIRVTP